MSDDAGIRGGEAVTNVVGSRMKIIAFITEWTRAAGTPVEDVQSVLGDLLVRYRGDVLRECVTALETFIEAQEWSDLYTDGIAAALDTVHELITPTMAECCSTGKTEFDRTLCAEPCGKMHYRCVLHDRVLDGCVHETGDASVDAKVFGRIIRRIRKRRDMTRRQLAAATELWYWDKAAIRSIERGEIELSSEERQLFMDVLEMTVTTDGKSLGSEGGA